jgi:hypothetical protein
MFHLPSSLALNLQLLVPLVISGLLISVAIAYTWRQHKRGRANWLSKKLMPVCIALSVGLFLSSILTQPHFRPISQTCQDYQLQKTLYSSTPATPSCDREIANSEAAYLATYPLFANQQSLLKNLGFLALAGGVVVALQARGRIGRTRRDILESETLRGI